MDTGSIAVTGASGFLGRHVLAALSAHDVSLVAMTRDRGRLAGLDPAVGIVELDLAAPGENVFDRLGRPDVLVHLAWDGLPNYRSPHHLESELPRQQAFLEPLIRAGLPALLVAGTCFEYGMQSGCLSETRPTRPDNAYGQAKDRLRQWLEALQAETTFALTWARLFYLYGEGQAESALYSQLRAAVARGDRVFDMSGGEQLRDFSPVEAVARTLARLAVAPGNDATVIASGDGTTVVNVCSGQPISVRALVERWLAENGWSIELNPGHYPYPDYEPMEFWGDRNKLDRLLRGDP